MDIVKRLNKIDFHDLPVLHILFNSDDSLNLQLRIQLSQDTGLMSYVEVYDLDFRQVLTLNSSGYELHKNDGLELYEFVYGKNKESNYDCNIILITGGLEMNISVICSTLELMPVRTK